MLHDDLGHEGRQRTMSLVKQRFSSLASIPLSRTGTKTSEYDQEISQSHTAENPVAP